MLKDKPSAISECKSTYQTLLLLLVCFDK